MGFVAEMGTQGQVQESYHCMWKGEDFGRELKEAFKLELSVGRKKLGNSKLNIIIP